MNLVAADVSPLHLDREGSLSRLTSATVQGFKARTWVGRNLSPSDGERAAKGRVRGWRAFYALQLFWERFKKAKGIVHPLIAQGQHSR